MSRFSFLKSIALVAAMAFLAGNIFPQTGPDLWGFDRSVLDYQFDRADRELSPGRWMEEARRGRDIALQLWEELIPQIADPSQGLDVIDVMKELAEWSEGELENRFTRWLLDRFFGDGLESAVETAAGEILKANKMFIYLLGENSRIVYDENTGDPVVIRPGTQGHEFEKDLASWRDRIFKTTENETALYEARLASLYPELLSYIAPENREVFEKKLVAASKEAVFSLRKEFAGLLAREERYFTARRLGDVWSLRKKSEDGSAKTIGSRIIEETNRIVAEGLAALEERIEAANAGTGDLAIAGTEWLDEYRTQFDRGLKAWADAEERFFIRRLEWELDAKNYYLEGEKAWNDAYESLEAERKNWEANAKILFESGEALFIDASKNLEKSISEAKLEFEKEAAFRVEAAAGQAGAWADMYITCGSVTAEARANIDFWFERYIKELENFKDPFEDFETQEEEEIPSFGDEEFDDWIKDELAFYQDKLAFYQDGPFFLQDKDNKTRETELMVMILGELENWNGIYASYYAKALDARDALINEFDFVMGSGTLISILNQGVSTDNFNLDEYQIELIRARAASSYWAKKITIAEKVSEYAEELTAGRITDSEGIVSWETAKKTYDDSLVLYKETKEKLSSAGTAAAEARMALSEVSVRLQEADMVLRELKQIYAKLAEVYDLQEDSFIIEELKSKYHELASVEKILDPSEPGSAWVSLHKSAVDLRSLEETAKGWELLEEFVTGNQTGKSLADLHDAFLEIKTPDEIGYFPADIATFGLREDKLQFSIIRELADQMKEKLDAAESEEDRELVSRNHEKLIGALVAQAKEEAKIEFETRLASISFLIDQSGAENLETRAGSAKRDLLKARISLELEALEYYLEGKPAGEDAQTLAWFCSLEETGAYRFKEILEELNDLINQNADKEFNELEMLLNAAAEESEEKYIFLNGGSFITPYSGMTESLLGNLYGTAKRSSGLLEAFMDSELFLADEYSFDSIKKEFVNSLEDMFEMLFSGTEEEFESWKDVLLSMLPEEAETGENQKRLNDLKNETLKYLDDPLAGWQGSPEIPDIQAMNDEYVFLARNIQNLLYNRDYLKKEIETLEKSAELLSTGLPELRNEMEAISSEISLKQIEHDNLVKLYEGRVKNLDVSGQYYDMVYREVKERYKEMEEAAFAYEIQDAIRRWASTAYLDSDLPKEELLYAREKFERSQAVLDVLVNLFNPDETRRSYKNEEYEILVNEYKESFSRKMLSQKTYDIIENALAREVGKNKLDYDAYAIRLKTMSGAMIVDSSYVSPDDKSLWGIIDMIRLKDGKLQFSYDDSYVFHGSENMADLKDYFTANIINGSETNYVSSFELAIRELSARLSASGLSMGKYQQLGFARDYLIKTLIQNNPEITNLGSWYHTTNGLLGRNSNLGQLTAGIFPVHVYWEIYLHFLPSTQEKAWNSLSDQEKEDLEFYTILTFLQGGGENSEYFSRISEYQEVYPAYAQVESHYNSLKRQYNWPIIGFLYKNAYNTAKHTKNALGAVFGQLSYYVNAGYAGLKTGTDSLNQSLAAYLESSERVNILYGGGNSCSEWDTVAKALNLTGGLEAGELLKLEEYWNRMAGEIDLSAMTLPEAVKLFAQWSSELKEESRVNLDLFWNENHSQFAEAEHEYYLVYQEYLNGDASLDQVALAAEKTYGETFPARKNHTENLAGSVMKDLFGFIERGKNRDAEYNSLASEYVAIISRAYSERYMAEMAGREVEWEERRQDIKEKYREWQNAALMMVEKGREDWKQTAKKLQTSYFRWINAYRDEYQRTDAAWNAAYLEGLKDKETWAAQAARAADEAASGAILALVGSSAESMARAMDTRDPVGIMNVRGIEEAETTLRQLLETAGFNDLNATFGALNSSSGALITEVRQGTGGPGGKNYGVLFAEASRLAKSAEEELAARESKKIALYVKNITIEALKLLSENVKKANNNFRKEMDETFILEGQWQKSGTFYDKDVLVHSTLFDNIITEKASVEGYRDYVVPALYLNTDLSEEKLKSLDTWTMDRLIGKIYAEVQEQSKKIFGSGDEGETGEFGIHLGHQPVIKSRPKIENGRPGVFDDYGAGEIGRLMTEFTYWKFKESYGIAALSVSDWNKPLWDSRNSRFQAPTIRSVTDMAVRIVTTIIGTVAAPATGGASFVGAIALNAAINSSDDLMFDLMDVNAGTRTWDEAGFNFGKNMLTNTTTAAVGTVFNGASGTSSGFLSKGGLTNHTVSLTNSAIGRTLAGATMKGLEAFTSRSLTSVIDAVSYDSENGWDFSRERLAAGLTSSWKTGLSSSAGFLASGFLDHSLEGFTGNLYSNGRSLNNLTGSLTSQGVNYALGEDFTLNLLSTSLFSENTNGIGLLELHLGREGVQMGLGTGGADVSIGTLISAAKGLETWQVNSEILFSGEESARKYASQLRTLYGMDGLYREEYENYIEGRTKIAAAYSDNTESVYDPATGIKTIYLGSETSGIQDRFGINVILAHEANRDGITGSEEEQIAETDRAVLGHMAAARELLKTYGGGLGLGMAIEALLFDQAQRTGDFSVVNALAGSYDSSSDYWLLLDNGSFAYDGNASLRDTNGNMIRSAQSMGVKETQIEGALIRILGLDPSDAIAVALVRNMMIEAGIQHSYSTDPGQWYWGGKQTVGVYNQDGIPEFLTMDLSVENLGRTISLDSIANLYADPAIRANKATVSSFLNKNYGSPVDFLNYVVYNNVDIDGIADAIDVSYRILRRAYNENDTLKIAQNAAWYNQARMNGITIRDMITGNVERTTEFAEELKNLTLATSSVPGAKTYSEEHTGVDYGKGGESISVPGGYWQFIERNGHRAYYQLYGGSLKMRLMHLNPDDLKSIPLNTIFGGENSKLVNYPTQSYGSGTGAHTHIDMTMRLPYNGYYTRQFVNPDTLRPGNQLNYAYSYKDDKGKVIEKHSGNFYRY